MSRIQPRQSATSTLTFVVLGPLVALLALAVFAYLHDRAWPSANVVYMLGPSLGWAYLLGVLPMLGSGVACVLVESKWPARNAWVRCMRNGVIGALAGALTGLPTGAPSVIAIAAPLAAVAAIVCGLLVIPAKAGIQDDVTVGSHR